MRIRTRVAMLAAAMTPVFFGSGGAPSQPRPVEVGWVVLGDSYVAGSFVGDPVGRPDGCERTSEAYPAVVGRRLREAGVPVRMVANVSCGGARIIDVTESQRPVGRDAPAGGWPAVPPQVDAVKRDVGLVTIGVGGNSVPLGDLLFTCLRSGIGQPDDTAPCRAAAEESVGTAYARVSTEYRNMLAEVRAAAPKAVIVTVGAPSVIPMDTRSCDRGDVTMFAGTLVGQGIASVTHADLGWIREVTENLNQIYAEQTTSAGGVYVDVVEATRGHDACRHRGVKWVEGVCGPPGTPVAEPIDALCATAPRGQRRATVVHPNAQGHAAVARQVAFAVARIFRTG
ncbi:SGNH/GDSL hydrolase family protein [Actinophytocola oryzae]|uniref:GDSL-like lipase/acylhydrolase family protein n=1 Tax=Actinophytocola oryzae TaxID=502181 RepID=A0A4R7W175_9PSEU|nr:SGNH/GDSL hydrolase family protein [Actinophytocola oryzae]TDV56290.1 GDSL-like lipase/acylhydrolase family protein [Actinophytocola oryzae]